MAMFFIIGRFLKAVRVRCHTVVFTEGVPSFLVRRSFITKGSGYSWSMQVFFGKGGQNNKIYLLFVIFACGFFMLPAAYESSGFAEVECLGREFEPAFLKSFEGSSPIKA